ncbi:hypothetical protein SERLADRAFT_405188 [Serpula lacrymans var. lacrymans S7.9]|uniref:Uncharacterized protein n=1 Tax=Serpula lacrymans var. lacrymans (strain S7.9) TaxID=578457 RepID=F8NIZ6_SERL9|nr:uncharacterized protein SERLADRAFT_405188 [Serpula lacrymans var. lacrymans S7.9]EGO29029.1 hypothetical protein SERLADRAFT_405188 [Serpula lacrymans var. lacrymans S7.9]
MHSSHVEGSTPKLESRSQRTTNTSSNWSFNHRSYGGFYCDSDDSGESDDDKDQSRDALSDDTQLFRDLDLASRQETVEYKPNPWTIAKINASSRPAASSKHIEHKAPSQQAPLKQPQGRIVDAFKKQAERPPPSHMRSVLKPDDSVLPQKIGLNAKQFLSLLPCDLPTKITLSSRLDQIRWLIIGKAKYLINWRCSKQTRGISAPNTTLVPVRYRRIYQPTFERCFDVSPAPRTVEPQRMPQWLASTVQSVLPSDPGLAVPPPFNPRLIETANMRITPAVSEVSRVPAKSVSTYESRMQLKSPSPPPPSSPPPISPPRKSVQRNPTDFSRMVSAYAFGAEEDSDATWTTLPSRKKFRAVTSDSRKNKIIQSGRFRLPIPNRNMGKVTSRSNGTKQEMQGNNRTIGARRVITYLPPPISPGGIVAAEEVAIGKPRPEKQRPTAKLNQVDTQSDATKISVTDANDITSNKSSTDQYSNTTFEELPRDHLFPAAASIVVDHDCASTEEPPQTHAPANSMCESATGTLVGDEGPIFAFDVNALVQRYPYTRNLMREQKRLREQLWDMLGLPSCGIVYCDQGGTLPLRRQELSIIVWPLPRAEAEIL